jgi:4-diphosphocytidyl-2-C-methyl-D-erythritol kinase
VRAHAKINLFLHVGERRSDGYHELVSLVSFTEAGDDLVAELADDLSLEVDGPFAAQTPSDETNIVLKAASSLRRVPSSTRGARLRLTKNVPVASGIGGGSADAAAALRLLNDLWRTDLNEEGLARIALELGADVPVCLRSRSAVMRGIGEVLEPAPPSPALPVVLVNPRAPVSTAETFRRLTIRSGAASPDLPDQFTNAHELARWLLQTRNDLEAPARLQAPSISEVLKALEVSRECLFARMSGSGATCFGLFESEGLAARAATQITARHPTWWVISTRLLPNLTAG